MKGATASNPMGTWEGSIQDITGPEPTEGWSDDHASPLIFAFPSPIEMNAYSFITAIPKAGTDGDPVRWILESSTNGTYWTHLDRRVYATPMERFKETERFLIS